MALHSTLLMSKFVTHDVRSLLLSRPDGLDWKPGQGLEVTIDADGWRDKGRPFTPTSLPEDKIVELTLKRYTDHDGVTAALHALRPGAALMLSEPFGSITYQGRGTFIAGGTGVTPFLAMLRQLARDDALSGHKLLLTNRAERDVICGQELEHYLGKQLVLTFTHEHDPGHDGHRIDAAFLGAHLESKEQFFYVCGPPSFVESINDDLLSLGVHPDRLIYER